MEFNIDPSTMVKLAVSGVVFVLAVIGAVIFFVKLFFGRVFAALKTLFDSKEAMEAKFLSHERKISRLEKTVIAMDPNQTQILRD